MGREVRVLVAKHLSHIRDLDCVFGNVTIDTVLAKNFKNPASLLERVKLTVPAYFADLPIVPSSVFSKSAPRLRHLHLYGFAWIEKSPLIYNLTHFSIGYHRPEVSTRLTENRGNVCHVPFPNFIDTLGHMTNLQELFIHDIAPSMPSLPEDVDRVITRPHLKVVSLGGEAPDCIHILEYLRFPSLNRFELLCGNPNIPFNALETLFRLIETHTRTPAFGALRTLTIQYRARQFNIRAWPLSTVFPNCTPRFTYACPDSSSGFEESLPLYPTVSRQTSDSLLPPTLRLALY